MAISIGFITLFVGLPRAKALAMTAFFHSPIVFDDRIIDPVQSLV